jgi:hypothetical protein
MKAKVLALPAVFSFVFFSCQTEGESTSADRTCDNLATLNAGGTTVNITLKKVKCQKQT